MSKVYEKKFIRSEDKIYVEIPEEIVESLGINEGEAAIFTLDAYKNITLHTQSVSKAKNLCEVCGRRAPKNECKTCGRHVCGNCWWAQGSVCAKCAKIKWKKHY